MTLSDTHLVLLSAAAQHELQLLTRPDKLFGKALEKLAGRLIATGLVEQVLVKTDQPHWSVNADGDAVGLRVTVAGLAAIGLGDESAAPPVGNPDPAPSDWADGGEQERVPVQPRKPQPRPGSKQALLVSMLRQESGASVAALMAATGWLPHTVRAALTGLRQKGYVLSKARDRTGVTHYHLTEPAGEAGVAVDADRAA